jgi:hypothetical protein
MRQHAEICAQVPIAQEPARKPKPKLRFRISSTVKIRAGLSFPQWYEMVHFGTVFRFFH